MSFVRVDIHLYPLFARLQNMMVDTVHYFSQLMWVIGNMVWAMGELWYPGFDDTPHIMWDW
jgi:hypothetical protein